MYKSDPPQCCYYITTFCQHFILDYINSFNYNHLARVYVLQTARLGKFLRSKRQRDLCQSQAQRSLFHFLAFMYKSDPPHCCYYICIFANIWYFIKLIHSIIIILRVFMFYKQRVLANFWGRKDSAICASRKRRGACYWAVHMKWATNSLFMPTTLSFRPQKSAKTRCI